MMLLQALGVRGRFGPVWRAYGQVHAQLHAQILAQVHAFVLARVVSFNSDDLRWAIVAMALRLLGAFWASVERQFSQWAQRVLLRAWRGARFAADMSRVRC